MTYRRPEFWPEPDRFKAGRHGVEAAPRPRFAFRPFGGGPRACIGERLAWMEGQVVTAALAGRWRVHPGSSQDVTAQAVIPLRPRGGLLVRLEERSTERPT